MKQHFEQLRLICIEHKLSSVLGLITDYHEWTFTKFNYDREIAIEIYSHDKSGEPGLY